MELVIRQQHERMRNSKFYCYSMYDDRWKPEGRESHTMVALNNCLYLYGGSGVDLYNTMSLITPEYWKWRKID